MRGLGLALEIEPVGVEDRAVGLRRRALHPLEQRRSEVEADPLVQVHDPRDPPARSRQARRGHRAVALLLDPLVPVMRRRRGRLGLDLVEPGILARRLIEVPVDDDGAGERHFVEDRGHSPAEPSRA